jgi:tetratricopeptide (TPR) repeat protein
MRLVAAAVCLALLLACSSLLAQTAPLTPNDQEAAKAHYLAGSAYYDQADYANAVREFNEAYRLSKRPDLLYNLAISYERQEQFDHAIAALERYLVEKPDAQDRAIIQSRIENLEKRRYTTRLTTPPQAAAPLAPVVTAAPPARTRHVVSLTVGAIGVAALAAALGTGISAQLLHDDLDRRCPGRVCRPSDQPDIDRGHALAVSTDVLIAVGAAATVTGVVLFVVETRRGRAANGALAPRLSSSAGALAVHF